MTTAAEHLPGPAFCIPGIPCIERIERSSRPPPTQNHEHTPCQARRADPTRACAYRYRPNWHTWSDCPGRFARPARTARAGLACSCDHDPSGARMGTAGETPEPAASGASVARLAHVPGSAPLTPLGSHRAAADRAPAAERVQHVRRRAGDCRAPDCRFTRPPRRPGRRAAHASPSGGRPAMSYS